MKIDLDEVVQFVMQAVHCRVGSLEINDQPDAIDAAIDAARGAK